MTYVQPNHKALYGVLFVMSLAAVAAGALVVGYTRSNHAYKFTNGGGFSSICFSFPDNDSMTWTNYMEVDSNGCLVNPQDVTDIQLADGELNYSTSAGRGLLAAGILGMAGGGIAFIVCCVGFYYAGLPCTEEVAK